MTMIVNDMFSVSRETLDNMRAYEALLVKWQKAINLVGPASLPDAWDRHFIDSLQLVRYLPAEARTLYDLGSGAGFPGLVLAMARPDLAVTLIESDQKKCAFLSTVSHETKTPVTVLAQRIEAAAATLPPPDVVTARALAPLGDLLAYIRPWVAANPNLVALFPKGARAGEEIAAARKLAHFDMDSMSSLTDPAAQILCLGGIAWRGQG